MSDERTITRLANLALGLLTGAAVGLLLAIAADSGITRAADAVVNPQEIQP